VGVPVGILDQAVSGFGRKDHLVYVDCKGPRFDTVPMPAGCHFWIFNTSLKHDLSDGLYAERYGECMQAARILGVPWLADATRDQLEAAKSRLPEAAYRRARHVIDECARVREVVRLLGIGDLAATGRLLIESHNSSRHWFANSTPELDFLVERLAKAQAIHGARLTGGGFGGAVMALASDRFEPGDAKRVALAYAARFGAELEILHVRAADGASVVRGLPSPTGR